MESIFKIKEKMKHFLLQINFFLIEILNISYNIFPNPLRNIYLRFFQIKILGFSSCIHRNCRFFHIGNFSIGKNSVINFGCYLDNRRGIYIGNNVGIAHCTKIYSLGHNIDSPNFETKGAPVYIRDNAFIFSNVLIMPGVTIGEGAIVLPGSVVTKNVEPWSVVGGNPAAFIKRNNRQINYKNNYQYWFAL